MARHKVEICGVDTANIKVLSNDEMLELFKRYRNNDTNAKEELINGNLKLVLSILKKYTNRCENMDDLFQVGCVGLIKAIDNFDLDHEVKFSTYAVPMILGEVKRYLRENSTLKISRSIKDTAYKALKLKEELTNKLGCEPTGSMLAKELGISEYRLNSALESTKSPISMFEPIYNDGGDTIYLEDQLTDSKDSEYSIETKLALKDALKKIRSKERLVLCERFITGKTQMELAEELGISQAQISRLEKMGIDNIKKLMN